MAFRKHCRTCNQETLHNEMKKKDQPDAARCTFCGDPISTNQEGKRAYQVMIRDRQVARRKLLV